MTKQKSTAYLFYSIFLDNHLGISISTAGLRGVVCTSAGLGCCGGFEGLHEVVDDVVDVLGADGDTDEILSRKGVLAFFFFLSFFLSQRLLMGE